MSTQAPALRSMLTRPSEPGWTLITFCSGSTRSTCIAGHKACCSTEDIAMCSGSTRCNNWGLQGAASFLGFPKWKPSPNAGQYASPASYKPESS